MRTIIAMLVTLSLTACAFAQNPPNLVKNPSMEELTEAAFARDWSGGEFGKPGKNVVTDTTQAHTGKASVRVGVSPGSFVTCAAADIPVKPQTTYYVTWWCKTSGMKLARAYVWLQTNKAQRVVPDDSQFGTSDWTQHFALYTTTAEETSLHPVLTTHDTGGGESCAWFDDVGVYEGTFPPELLAVYKAHQRSRAGVSETATVLSKTASLTVWADDLAARIYKEDGVPDYAKPAKQVSLAAARGEIDYYQIALLPTSDLTGVTLQPGDLKGPGTIAKDSVSWWPVGFANVKTAHRQTTRLGLTPDPLLKPEPTDAKAGENAPFLIGVRVPRTARPGTYTGTVAVLSAGKQIASVPLSLRVYNFTLPADPTFRTLITYSAASFRPWDKRPLDEIEHDIARVLFDHGIRGNGATATVPAQIVDGQVVCDFTAFDARIQWFIDNLRFNAFFLGPMFGGGTSEGWEHHSKWLGMEPLSEEFNRLFPEYMRQVGAHLRAKGWLDMAYLYLWDEPEPDYFDKVVALQKLALQGDAGFKVWETTSPAHQAFWGVVKAWSVPFGRPHFEEESVEARRQAGDEIWVYNIPATLEAAPQIHRLWFWAAARYGAIGAQLWQTTFYHGIDPWEDITPTPYPVGRGGKQLYYYDAGQAILLYPDKQGGPPFPTLRLKLLQKGLDDFEYLHILEAKLTDQARRQKTANPEAVAQARMREFAGRVVRDIGKYEMDVAALRRARGEIAAQIEKLSR
jgi:hypothetical protein